MIIFAQGVASVKVNASPTFQHKTKKKKKTTNNKKKKKNKIQKIITITLK